MKHFVKVNETDIILSSFNKIDILLKFKQIVKNEHLLNEKRKKNTPAPSLIVSFIFFIFFPVATVYCFWFSKKTKTIRSKIQHFYTIAEKYISL